MSLNRGWILAVSVVAMSVSLSSAASTGPYPPSPCDEQLNTCLYYANQEDEEYWRMIRTDQCYVAHDSCLEQTTYCGDGRCAGGESCSSCATDCTFTSTSDLGTQTRDCSSAYHSSYVAYSEGRPQNSFCYYPIYQVNAVTCSVYRTTQFYNSCGNPPYSTQETYEGTTTTYEKMQIGWDTRYGPC